jgi:hypothetical protein
MNAWTSATETLRALASHINSRSRLLAFQKMALRTTTATVTSEVRPAPVETRFPTLTVVETSLRSFQPAYLQYQLRLQHVRLLHSMPLARLGAQTPLAPAGVQPLPLLVAGTRIVLVPFGNFGVKVDSMLSRPKSLSRAIKVYMVAGRAVTTDLGVLPSFMTERSVVCVETIIASQLSNTNTLLSGSDQWHWNWRLSLHASSGCGGKLHSIQFSQ